MIVLNAVKCYWVDYEDNKQIGFNHSPKISERNEPSDLLSLPPHPVTAVW